LLVLLEPRNMKTDELKRRLSLILAEEEGSDVDWDAVAAMSAQLTADLGHSLPPIASDFLVSVERRREDPVFALAQRSVLLQYLRSG
jgi:hypothetical protein